MKNILAAVILCLCGTLVHAQQQNTKEVTTTGVFSSTLVRMGNFEPVTVYKLNEFCILPADIRASRADSLNGKKVSISGVLRVVQRKAHAAKSNVAGRKYETYQEPDLNIIARPVITVQEEK